MHLRQLWIMLGMMAVTSAGAAVVYKWTDADGVVHFSDQPVEGAEKIITSSNTSSGVGGGAPPPPTPAAATPPAAPVAVSVSIVSPAPEQVFFNDDPVVVRLSVTPALQPTQVITWRLNGAILTDQGPTAESFTLPTLARGTYSISASVTDAATGAALQTSSVTFYVRQPSELAPLRRH